MPMATFQGRAETSAGANRKRRAIPPAYGAQAFHVPPTANESGATQGFVPPPRAATHTPPHATTNGDFATSSPVTAPPFAAPAPATFTVGASPHIAPVQSFSPVTSPLPGVAAPQTATLNDTPSPATSSSPPVGLPPPGAGRRDAATSASGRTRRLAAPTASYAAEKPLMGSGPQPPTAVFAAPQQPAFMPEPVLAQPVASLSPARIAPTTFAPQQSAKEAISTPSPALSPSMFSPVGKGVHLFDSKPEHSSHPATRAVPTLPTTTADFFALDENENDSSDLFGAPAAPNAINTTPQVLDNRLTQPQVVNRLFEATPSPSPPPNNFPPLAAQTPQLSNSAAGLFDDESDGTSSSELFGTPSITLKPATASFSPAEEKVTPHVAVTAPTPSKSTQQNTSNVFSSSPANSNTSDLFGEDDGDDFLSFEPAPSAHVTTSIHPVQEKVEHVSSMTSHQVPTLNASQDTQPAISFLRLAEDVAVSTPIAPAGSPAPFSDSETMSFQSEPAIMVTPMDTPKSRSISIDENGAPSLPSTTNPTLNNQNASFKPSIDINNSDDLFGDDDGEDLDFGSFAPTVASPAVPVQTPQITSSSPMVDTIPEVKGESIQKNADLSLPSSALAISPSTFIPPVTSQDPLFGDEDDEGDSFTSFVAPQKATTTTDQFSALPPAPSLAKISEPIEVGPPVASIAEKAPIPTLEEAPKKEEIEEEKFEESPVLMAPPPASSRASGRASGPKRPRHFQYTAGQAIPVPSQQELAKTGPPPKSSAATNQEVAAPPPKSTPFIPLSGTPLNNPIQVHQETGGDTFANGPIGRGTPEPQTSTNVTPNVATPAQFVPGANPPTFLAAPTPFMVAPSVLVNPVVAQDESQVNDFGHGDHSSSHEQSEGKKPSLFEPLGQLQSRGLNWFKSTIATVMSPNHESEQPKQERFDSPEPIPSYPTFQPLHRDEEGEKSNAADSRPPLPFAVPAVGSVPLPRVGGAAKKKGARPGPFKSAVASAPNALAPSLPPNGTSPAPITSQSTSVNTSSGISSDGVSHSSPDVQESLDAPPATQSHASHLPPTSSVSLPEDDHFQVASGLVSFDYDENSASKGSAIVAADPFGSDEHVSASDLFSKLRSSSQAQSAQIPPINTTSSDAKCEILASPATSQLIAKSQGISPSNTLNDSKEDLPNQQKSSQGLDHSDSSIASSASQNVDTPIKITLTASIDSKEHGISDSAALKEAQRSIESLTAQVSSLTSQLDSAHQNLRVAQENTASTRREAEQAQRDQNSSKSLVSELQASERDLKSQISALMQKLASNSESGAAQAISEQKLSDLSNENVRLASRASELESRLKQAELQLREIKSSKEVMASEYEAKISKLETSSSKETESRVLELQKSLEEVKRKLAEAEASAERGAAEAANYRLKLEGERSTWQSTQRELNNCIDTMKTEHETELNESARARQRREHELNLEIQELRRARAGTADVEKKYMEEYNRLLSEKEQYIEVMQRQAASQNSLIDRLILQNADLVKAVEFARRVLHESKNPDSLGAALSENDRLQEDLEENEKELATLRQRNKELEFKSAHFETECDELLRRLHSIDYRTLAASQTEMQQPENFNSGLASNLVDPSSTNISSESYASSSSAGERSTQSVGEESIEKSTPAKTLDAHEPQNAHQTSHIGQTVPSTPGGDWKPQSPAWSPHVSESPGKTPSRLAPSSSESKALQNMILPLPSSSSVEMTTEPKTILAVPSVEPLFDNRSVDTQTNTQPPAPFVVTAQVSQIDTTYDLGANPSVHLENPSLPGLHHASLSPTINLDDMEEVHGIDDPSPLARPDVGSAPGTPSRSRGPLLTPPKRTLMGRIWQAVTLQ